jgi:glycosyltransferase involved in cell wall biosynthesis
MKIILWHENYYPVKGGGPAYIKNFIKQINNFNYDIITNFIKGYPSYEQFNNNSIIHRLPLKPIIRSKRLLQRNIQCYPFHLINEFQTLKTKFNYLKKSDFDIFNIHGVSYYSFLRNLNKWTHLKIYQKLLDFSFIKQPKLLTLHNCHPMYTKDKIIVDTYNHYIDQFDNIICVDKHIYNYTKEYCINNQQNNKRIWFIPNSIDTDLYCHKNDRAEKFTIGFAGRIASTSDIDMLNQLIKKIPDNIRFKLAFSGDLSLINIPENKNNIRIFQNLSQNEMTDFYNSVNILFNPILHKAISRVTMEAMSCEVPVMMYNYRNRSEFFNEENGIEIKPNVESIVSIIDYYSKNSSILKDMGRDARKTITEHYSNDVIMPQLKEIYEALISGKYS